MTEASADPPDIDGTRSGAQPKAYGSAGSLPVNGQSSASSNKLNPNNHSQNGFFASSNDVNGNLDEKDTLPGQSNGHVFKDPSAEPAPSSFAKDEGPGTIVEPDGDGNSTNPKKKRTIIEEIKHTAWLAISHSWGNVLLVFVPVGIAVAQVDSIHGGVVFAMNCIAIIPLAGLLAYATESVATNMGDALGALLNVTFGNAVELIIFIIALVKNEIRIVQASLLGSILANLLLILGMGFFLGGLRFREQIYNSTVTQMSACLLSLSVISLVLPTAFHASFSDDALADSRSLKISRGTSVILLLVYVIYLLFQLKSHAYMYESTPQHIVDAESTPGPAAAWLDASSSESSSSSSSDSDDSDHSRDTMRRRVKKVLRSRRRRKSSFASMDTNDKAHTRTSSFLSTPSPNEEAVSESSSSRPRFPRIPSAGSDNAIEDDEDTRSYRKHRYRRHKHKKSKRRAQAQAEVEANGNLNPTATNELPENGAQTSGEGEPRRVDFAVQTEIEAGTANAARRPFPALRGMSVKNLAPTVFTQKPEAGITPSASAGPVPRVRYGIRRTNSLPDRLNQQNQFRPPGAMLPAQVPLVALANGTDPTDEDEEEHLSRWGAVCLLLVSTALVAVCAEFLVDSIEEVVSTSSVGETFIGLIILPIVGNAAEHVTAITVAMKNKMDLAIGVAVGSSIQIAIFITPLVVIIGWIMDKEMTLYFTLFETVCLFVSAFIVNFLVLDGRSNYLEGALLCAVYIIISIMAFFYPDEKDASAWGN